MKKMYEVPAMEIVRLDASENIAKLPTVEYQGSTTDSTGRVTTKTRTSNLVQALLGGATSTSVEA